MLNPSRKALLALLACSLTVPAHAFLHLYDEHVEEQEVDFRTGERQPSAQQLARAQQLGAKVQWNRYGTVHTLIKQGGFLAQGFEGSPVQVAREWVSQNRVLFGLSETGVSELQLVNEGEMPHTEARAVLFRQSFGGVAPTLDGQIVVGVIGDKVYYASSSSAGDQPPAAPVELSAREAWLRAAADVNRFVSADDILSLVEPAPGRSWTLMTVAGFAQEQRSRLTVVPMPAGGVRHAYETVVLDVQGGHAQAHVHFVDAQTGAILRRENRVNHYADASRAQPFSGALNPAGGCSARHAFSVDEARSDLTFAYAPVAQGNQASLNLYRQISEGESTSIPASELQVTGNRVRYAPATGVSAGTYVVEICNASAQLPLPPLNYVGALMPEGDNQKSLDVPSWQFFPSNPDLQYTGVDNRKRGCWGPGCDIDLTSIASRQPWDMLLGEVPTFTTIGNNAITAQAWLSPLTPAENYRPVSPMRTYEYPFTNAWNSSGCNPQVFASPARNDIDATIVNLFVAHNLMHDFTYFLGFTERNFNLQLSNYGLTPLDQENDPEIGNVQAGAITGNAASPAFAVAPGRNNANQITLQDGVPGITNQYLFQPIGGLIAPPCADGDYDNGIIGHEYGHAVSNRMIGGPDAGIGGHQGGAMGESWSDQMSAEHMFARGYYVGSLDNPASLAAYATGGIRSGIRNFALNDNPLNYSNVGYDTPGPQVHADGEIWSGTNWQLRQAFIDAYNEAVPVTDVVRQRECAEGVYGADACPGNRRWIQLMFDSFLLMPASPSMLDARDAMLAADVARFGGANQELMWKVFAARGMGEFAVSADTSTFPNFESPLTEEAVVTFKAVDESKAPIAGALLYVGRFATRSRPIADTASANTFAIVPGTYELMVEAPGYGIHRFTQTFEEGPVTLTFTLPTNWASSAKGATAITAATLNPDQGDRLIDDTENTGGIIGDDGVVEGAHLTVQLAGGAQKVSRVHVSTAAGPQNPGRFNALRAFEVRTCNGACTDPVADFSNVAYVSPADAFPAGTPRPLQPNLNLRSFDFPEVEATHVQLRVISSQCTGTPEYQGDDSDPLNNADCPSSMPIFNPTAPNPNAPLNGSLVRATEFQVFTTAASVTGGSAPAASVAPRSGRFGSGALGLPLIAGLMGLLWLRRRSV